MEVQNQDQYSNPQAKKKNPEISLLVLHSKLTEAKINWYPAWREHVAFCRAYLGGAKIGAAYTELVHVLSEIEAGTKKRS